MKLTEIKISDSSFQTHSSEEIQTAQAHFNKTVDKTVKLEDQYELKITSDDYFALFKRDALVGWVRLEPMTVKGVRYRAVSIIYLIPSVRKTKALLILLNAVRSELKVPVLVDGSIFHDGVTILASLKKREEFKLSILDLKSGARSKFDDVPNEADKAVIVEGFDLP